ncbi:MAG: pantetheine-phosphate adenylyltransferase [Deltaproteobacteria bacterium]|jgi:pantetheine-phosphate adenylyltransferase|nr:pantetheine-phosphate adenylyltransferase [Deltaproteobacteria bacterium]
MGASAVYPGSFDPPTLGHVSLVERGLAIFDKLIVAVATNPEKGCLFTADERVELLSESLLDRFPRSRIEIDRFEGLTIDYARRKGAAAVLRGLRATSDFEFEFRLAMMNRHLDKGIHSVFLMADSQWFFISSSTVKEAASLGADISDLVPGPVAARLKAKYPAIGRGAPGPR